MADLVERLRAAEKELEQVRAAQVLAAAAELAANPKDVFGVRFVGHRAPDGVGGGDLRKLALDVRGRMPADQPAVVAVRSANDGKPGVVVALNDTAREWRLKAGDLVRVAAEALGGRGGGKDDVAQGGGTGPGRCRRGAGRGRALRRPARHRLTESWRRERGAGRAGHR